MIKRFAAISFTLLANIILLAHVVLPHHHHDEEICMESQHCETEGTAHDHEKKEADHKDHKHHGESETSSCVLDQDIPILTKKIKKSFSTQNDLAVDYYSTIYISSINGSVCSCKANNSHAPPIISKQHYSEYAPVLFGLRAPPSA